MVLLTEFGGMVVTVYVLYVHLQAFLDSMFG